jgi:uncharacterized protein YutD
LTLFLKKKKKNNITHQIKYFYYSVRFYLKAFFFFGCGWFVLRKTRKPPLQQTINS